MGRPDVRALQKEITSEQFAEWVAYARLEPWGPLREDWRSGMLAATVANAMAGRRGGTPWGPADFVATLRRPGADARGALLAALTQAGARLRRVV